ncbi:hypothetical protein CHS0354_032886 [Potamilus streckersoni]|uniref:U5 small nuclear ribonucleoprotein TSSC4 n=1 Tax=Potamilus streckersoni TaxID=2493646 RepID=A0AAE0VYY7_9BIVA|nr:hypothetical protein CHS0354_032886 [Potamilus streckersoni]
MNISMEGNIETTVFLLKGESNDFTNRCKDIFSNLKTYEDKHNEFEQSRAQSDLSEDHKLLSLEPDSTATETIMPAFKTPKLPTRKGCHQDVEEKDSGNQQRNNWNRSVDTKEGAGRTYSYQGRFKRGGLKRKPDFEVHPDKWTRYSLEDVTDEDMSSSANKKAALAFLAERRAIQEAENAREKVDVDSNACSRGAFTFKRVKKTSASYSEKNEKDSLNESAEVRGCSLELDDTNENDSKHPSDIESKMIFKSRKPSRGKSIRIRRVEEEDDNA